MTLPSWYFDRYSYSKCKYAESMRSIWGKGVERIQASLRKYYSQKTLSIYWMDNNYPIVLKYSNAITFRRITSFMKTKKNVVTVDMQLLLNKISTNRCIRTRKSNDTDVRNIKVSLFCSVSLYMGIHSEI